MTQPERADVWRRRLEAKARLKLAVGKDETEKLQAVVEACNTELITNKYNPPPIPVDEPASPSPDGPK